MSASWKALLVTCIAYQAVLTYVVLRLDYYAQRLHFADTEVIPEGTPWWDYTAPMQSSVVCLVVTIAGLGLMNLIVFGMSQKKVEATASESDAQL